MIHLSCKSHGVLAFEVTTSGKTPEEAKVVRDFLAKHWTCNRVECSWTDYKEAETVGAATDYARAQNAVDT